MDLSLSIEKEQLVEERALGADHRWRQIYSWFRRPMGRWSWLIVATSFVALGLLILLRPDVGEQLILAWSGICMVTFGFGITVREAAEFAKVVVSDIGWCEKLLKGIYSGIVCSYFYILTFFGVLAILKSLELKIAFLPDVLPMPPTMWLLGGLALEIPIKWTSAVAGMINFRDSYLRSRASALTSDDSMGISPLTPDDIMAVSPFQPDSIMGISPWASVGFNVVLSFLLLFLFILMLLLDPYYVKQVEKGSGWQCSIFLAVDFLVLGLSIYAKLLDNWEALAPHSPHSELNLKS